MSHLDSKSPTLNPEDQPSQHNPQGPTVTTATTIPQLKGALHSLRVRHASTTSSLDALVTSHQDLDKHLARIDLTRARLSTISNSARALSHGQLSSAAATASRLSDAVSRLDLEQDRVRATLAVVEQVAELKQCVLGVVGSMGAPQDWETAAQYIHRAALIPREVTTSGFAEAMVPTAEVPDPPAATLDGAAEALCRLFLKEFGRAVDDGDGARITRFFKMFPLIGRSGEGLEAYGRYVCQGVAARARGRLQGVNVRGDGFACVTALTRLFEHIAQVVDGHSGLVRRHYGVGTMVEVMQRLHAEADKQGGIVLDTWYDERGIDRKLTDVKSYAYSFLVQSFLQPPKAGGTPRSMSPNPRGRAPQEQQEEGVEMKEVDQALSEITAMLGHWALYQRFISSRAAESETEDSENIDTPELSVPAFLANSSLPQKVSSTLEGPFKSFATFFLRRSVEKAFQLEDSPADLTLNLARPIASNPPFITSVVDDVMYMVSQLLQRTLATSQAAVVTAIVASAERVLTADFIGMIQRKMRDESYPKAAVPGAMPPEDKTIQFLVLCNSLDVATDYIRRIVRAHVDSDAPDAQANGTHGAVRPLAELFPMGKDAATVRKALLNLESSFCAKATDLIKEGVYVAFIKVTKERMRPLVADVFRDADYTAIEPSQDRADGDASNDEDAAPSVRTLFESGWDGLISPMRRLLTAANAERLLLNALAHLAGLLEKRIWNYHGRVGEFGAVQLERDVADVVGVATRGGSFTLRENFNRCLQVIAVMNMDEEEWEEVEEEAQGEDGMWVLSVKERQRARGMIRGRVGG